MQLAKYESNVSVTKLYQGCGCQNCVIGAGAQTEFTQGRGANIGISLGCQNCAWCRVVNSEGANKKLGGKSTGEKTVAAKLSLPPGHLMPSFCRFCYKVYFFSFVLEFDIIYFDFFYVSFFHDMDAGLVLLAL